MPIQAQPPGEAQQSPFSPSTIEPLLFEDFMGINTSALRAGVPDKQMSWCDGFMPIAPRNLRTLPGVGSPVYVGAANTIVWFDFYNIAATPYMVVFLTDGSVLQVNTTNFGITTILPPGTITTPSILTCDTSQWGNQYLIIVADQTNGYWLWDGTLLFQSGQISPVVTLTNVGSGYTSTPTIIVSGGHGSGASVVASINASAGIVVSASVVNPGTGYLAGDQVSLTFVGGNTSGSGASITASMVGIFPQIVSTLNIVAGGSLYSNNPTLSFVSTQTLASATALATVVGGTITSTSITYGGSYGTVGVTVVITDTAVNASATLQLMPVGVSGTAVETYQSRVWVAKQALIQFTAPGSFSDFSTSNGGGAFTSRDSFLRVGFVQLISSNGFLYLIADSSVNYISGVQTSGSPPTTTFTNQNADPQVGSPYPASVETFGRDVLFANDFGIHVINGAQVVKVSEMLDGVYNTVPQFGGLQLASSQAIVFGKKVWMTLVKVVDPISLATVNKLFMFNGKQWWSSQQDMTLTYIKHQEINSIITAWGTDGTIIKPLFNTASTAFSKVAQSRLWDAPGGYQFIKTPSRFWLLAHYKSTSSPNIVVTIDNETSSVNTYTLTPAALGYYVSPPQAVGQQGVLSGMTFTTSAADMSIVTAMIEDEIVQYRG